MASESGGGESSDLSGSVARQGALAMLANMQLSSERIRELSDGARGNPCLMLNLYFSQEESNKRSSSIIPPAKRSRSVRVVNAAAAGEKAVAKAAAKKKKKEEEEEARVEELIKQHEEAAEKEEVELEDEELIERYGVSTGVGWKEEFWVKNRDVPASDGDGDEGGAEAKGLPKEGVDGGEEEVEVEVDVSEEELEPQVAGAHSATQSGDVNAVAAKEKAVVETEAERTMEVKVARVEALIKEHEAGSKKNEAELAKVAELLDRRSKKDEAELAKVAELLDRRDVSTGVEGKEELRVVNRDVPASDSDWSQAAAALLASHSGGGEGGAVGVKERPLVEALEQAVASMQAVIDELRAREARG